MHHLRQSATIARAETDAAPRDLQTGAGVGLARGAARLRQFTNSAGREGSPNKAARSHAHGHNVCAAAPAAAAAASCRRLRRACYAAAASAGAAMRTLAPQVPVGPALFFAVHSAPMLKHTAGSRGMNCGRNGREEAAEVQVCRSAAQRRAAVGVAYMRPRCYDVTAHQAASQALLARSNSHACTCMRVCAALLAGRAAATRAGSAGRRRRRRRSGPARPHLSTGALANEAQQKVPTLWPRRHASSWAQQRQGSKRPGPAGGWVRRGQAETNPAALVRPGPRPAALAPACRCAELKTESCLTPDLLSRPQNKATCSPADTPRLPQPQLSSSAPCCSPWPGLLRWPDARLTRSWTRPAGGRPRASRCRRQRARC